MGQIKTALCSFGMSGRCFHAPFIDQHPGFELYAAFERTKNLAAEKYPGIITYRSLPDLLNNGNIDLVIVNTPNATHYEYTKAALLAGKHVIVEKPFSITRVEGEELIDLANHQHKKLSVYQNRRWDSDFLTVSEVIHRKLLGNIVEAEIHFDRFSETLSPKLHKEIPGPGAGIVYDLGPHCIDQALQLFGIPLGVFADILVTRPVSQVEDYFEIILMYERMRVRLKAGYLVREALPSFILHGDKGSFIKPRADVQEADLLNAKLPGSPGWGTEPETGMGLLHTEMHGAVIREYIPSEKGNYMEYYNGIYNAITNNGPLPVTAEEGLSVIRIIEAAYTSASGKRVVEL